MTHQEKQKEQSKKWIASAFFTLLKNKDYTAVTVSEIAKKADLSRRTFYRLFDCKQDIIEYMFEEIFPDYICAVKELPAKKREYLAIAVVEFVNKHLEFFRCLKRNHLDYLMIDFFDSHLANGRDCIWEHPFSENDEVEQVFLMTISIEHYNIIRLWLALYDKKRQKKCQNSYQTLLHYLAAFNNIHWLTNNKRLRFLPFRVIPQKLWQSKSFKKHAYFPSRHIKYRKYMFARKDREDGAVQFIQGYTGKDKRRNLSRGSGRCAYRKINLYQTLYGADGNS